MAPPLRSRTGCWTCRQDGYKCDEQKPSCNRCLRLKKACQGYGVRLKWQTRAPNGKPSTQRRSDPRSQIPGPGPLPLARVSDVKFGDEKLVHHWNTVLAGIVSISASQQNPFLSHLTPLLDQSMSVRSVVASMAANHLATLQPDTNLAAIAIHHRLRAIAHLRESLSSAHPETSLATVILLQISERIFATDTKVNHLEGAKALIRYKGGQAAWSSPTGQFLLGLCWYHDVLSSVSKSQPPLLGLEGIPVEGLNSLSKLSHILQLVGEISRLRSKNCGWDDVEARAVLRRLIALEQSHLPDEDARNVEIHRQAAFIYFYRSTAKSNDTEALLLLHAKLCLEHLAKIPCTSALISSHIWPLWTAGCEAVDPTLREFVLQRLEDMFQARQLTYLQRVKQDVLGVWYMKDLRRNASGKDDIDCVNAIRSTHHREADII